MFGRRPPQSPSGPAYLPTPGPDDPVRAFAYEALRRARSTSWVRFDRNLDDAVGVLLREHVDVRHIGARWTGAGVLRTSGTTWFGFDGGDRSAIAFIDDGMCRPAPTATYPMQARARHRARVGAEPEEFPAELLESVRAWRVVPVWEIAGLAHLAPGALRLSGCTTMAA